MSHHALTTFFFGDTVYEFFPCYMLQRIQDLVELIVSFCDFNAHNVSHVCCNFLLPTPRGSILKSSLAFIQLQICFNVDKKIVYDVVEVSAFIFFSHKYVFFFFFLNER